MLQTKSIGDLLVVDLSHWNWDDDIDFHAMKADGVKGVIIKATEGQTYVDPKLHDFYNRAKEAGLLIGFYHFARFGDEIKEAQHFVSAIKGLDATLPGAKYNLDLEVNSGGFSPDVLTEKADHFLEFVGDPADVAFYSYTAFIKAHITKALSHRRLWLAHYTTASRPGENGIWDEWYIWQYTSSGSVKGIKDKTIDLNAFHMINTDNGTSNTSEGNNNTNTPTLLKTGVSGAAVKILQKQLIDLGYDLGSSGADGIFGSHTEKAVRNFQADHHLKIDGIVGNETKTALTAAIDRKHASSGQAVRAFPRHVFQVGDRGRDVTAIQHALNTAIGKKILVEDGIFGNNTKKAVMDYQKRHNLKVDGIVGRYTWDMLF